MQNDEERQERLANRVIGDSQRRVIDMYTTPGAPKIVRLLAAPGTGKTTTGCYLIKEMFLDARNPLYPNFLFLTFTRRTRIDLVRKIHELQGYRFNHKQYVFSRIRNFHSLAYGLVFWNGIVQKQTDVQVFDQFLEQIHIPIDGRNRNRDYEKTRIRKLAWKKVHQYMAEAFTPEQKEEDLQILRQNPRNVPVIQLIQKYQSWLKQQYERDKLVTFDEAICLAIDKIRAGKQCHKIDLDSIDLIIVDEFQDSNPAQIRLVESLIQRTKKDVKVLMIGDFDQNIYLWRGAKFRVVQEFIERYPCEQMFLEQTYRLSQSIMNISQRLIVSDPRYQEFRRRFYQNYRLRALNTKRDHTLQVLEFQSEYSEVRWVVDTIYRHIQNGAKPKDITVLCRQFQNSYFYKKFKIEMKRKSQELGVEEVLIDYQNSGDSLGSEEAKYFIALLKYFYETRHLHRPNADANDIKRILQLRSVGDADDVLKEMIQARRIDPRLNDYSRRQRNQQRRQASWRQFFIDFQRIEDIIFNGHHIQDNLLEIADILRNAAWLSKNFSPTVVTEFIDTILQISESIDREEFNQQPTLSVIKKLLQDRRYNQLLNDIQPEEGPQEEPEEQHPQRLSMRSRRDLALMRELEVRANRNRICVQTMHNAKGLEYPIVFLCALDFGYIQSDYEETQWRLTRITDAEVNRMQQQQRDAIIEKQSEELRLIYTSITRTSGYVYACASREDNFNSTKFPPLPEHKVFAKLKELCGVTQPIPYNEELDNRVKETIERELNRQANRPRRNRGRGRGRANP